MGFSNFIKTLFPVIPDEPKTKPFSVKLCETIDRAENQSYIPACPTGPDWTSPVKCFV